VDGQLGYHGRGDALGPGLGRGLGHAVGSAGFGPAGRRRALLRHGKIENLSALFETLLLLGTCAWIIREAVGRLFFRVLFTSTPTSGRFWSSSFLSSLTTPVRGSHASGQKARSQALEADALHFATDIWSSLVVLAGFTRRAGRTQ